MRIVVVLVVVVSGVHLSLLLNDRGTLNPTIVGGSSVMLKTMDGGGAA